MLPAENILNLGHFARWSIRVHVPFRGTHWPFAVGTLLGWLYQQRWLGGSVAASVVSARLEMSPFSIPMQAQIRSEMNNWLNFRREVKNRLNMTKGPKDNDNEFQVLHLLIHLQLGILSKLSTLRTWPFSLLLRLSC